MADSEERGLVRLKASLDGSIGTAGVELGTCIDFLEYLRNNAARLKELDFQNSGQEQGLPSAAHNSGQIADDTCRQEYVSGIRRLVEQLAAVGTDLVQARQPLSVNLLEGIRDFLALIKKLDLSSVLLSPKLYEWIVSEGALQIHKDSQLPNRVGATLLAAAFQAELNKVHEPSFLRVIEQRAQRQRKSPDQIIEEAEKSLREAIFASGKIGQGPSSNFLRQGLP